MRILIADHHAQALWALKTTLQEQQELKMIGEAIDAQSLIALAEKQVPDLILLDRELPGEPIENLIAELHAIKPKPVVIVMSSDIECSRRMLQAGADAFVSKGDQPDWLLETLHKYAHRKKAATSQKDNSTG